MSQPDVACSGLGLTDLVKLVENGNRDLALTWWPDVARHAGVAPVEQAHQRQRLLQMPARQRRSFFPVVTLGECLTDSIDINVDGERSANLDSDAQRAVEAALARAWHDVGARGPLPAVGWSFGLGGLTDIKGSSLYLASYLAALGCFGDQRLTRSVLATGAFDADVRSLRQKAGFVATADRELLVGKLLVASRSAGEQEPSEALQVVSSHQEAAHVAFGIFPWHPDAGSFLHVYSGESRRSPPAWADPARCRLEAFGPHIGPADLPRVLDRALGSLSSGSHVELSIGGPIMLAAALGVAARNHPAGIRVVDPRATRRADRVVWHNHATTAAAFGSPGREARVIIANRETKVPDGWEVVRVPNPITANQVTPVIEEVLKRFGATPVLHVAFATWLPLAWAIAGMLKNAGRRIYYQYEEGRYRAWFEVRGDGQITPISGQGSEA